MWQENAGEGTNEGSGGFCSPRNPLRYNDLQRSPAMGFSLFHFETGT